MNNTASVGSLAFKVCLFLALNPDEALSMRDTEIKFGSSNARCTLRAAIKAGYLRYWRDGQNGMVCAGPALFKLMGTRDTTGDEHHFPDYPDVPMFMPKKIPAQGGEVNGMASQLTKGVYRNGAD